MKFVWATESDKGYFGNLFRVVYAQVIEDQFGIWTEEQFDELFENVWISQAFRKIYIEDQLVGGVWVDKNDDYWQLREIQIDPSFQGRGIGTEVLLKEIELATLAKIELRLRVLVKNKAINLYTKLGFTKEKEDEKFIYMSYRTSQVT